jgi:AraC-like DNA-binding protein
MFEFAINVFNLIIVASVFIGTTFGLLLIFTKRINQRANVLLGLLAFVIVFWNIWVLSVDFQVFDYYPRFCLIPLNFSLALGPLLYLYTKKLTDASFKIGKRQLLHFAPLLLEILMHFMVSSQALSTGIEPVETTFFGLFMPFIQLLTIISIISYSVNALKEIRKYHIWIDDNYSKDEDYQLQWLYRLIIVFGFLWLILLPYTAIDYFFFDFNLSIADYYPIYILMSVITIWISAEAFLRPEVVFLEPNQKETAKDQGIDENLSKEALWLRKEVERNQYFLDPEITLRKLSADLDIHPNHLSKLINSGLGKNFADFINEYRVKAFISKINDPKYSHITLLGISFECGFNSKTTFNRVFKNMTGKTPLQFKKMGSKV